jgi:hypothetical protein
MVCLRVVWRHSQSSVVPDCEAKRKATASGMGIYTSSLSIWYECGPVYKCLDCIENEPISHVMAELTVDVFIPRFGVPTVHRPPRIPIHSRSRSKPDIAARTTSFAALAAHFVLARRF